MLASRLPSPARALALVAACWMTLGCRSGAEPTLGPVSTGRTHPEGVVVARAGVRMPTGASVSSRGTVYITSYPMEAITRGDVRTGRVGGAITVAGSFPFDVAFNSQGTVAYVAGMPSGAIGIVDVARNRLVGSITRGLSGTLAAIEISPDDRTLYVTSNSGRLYVVDVADRAVTAAPDLGGTSSLLVLHPTEPRLYACVPEGDGLVELDLSTNTRTRAIPICGAARDLAIAPDGSELYMTDVELSALVIYDIATGARVGVRDGVSGFHGGVAATPDGEQIYVVGSTGIAVVDRATRRVLRTIRVGAAPSGVRLSPDGAAAVVTSLSLDSVYVIR